MAEEYAYAILEKIGKLLVAPIGHHFGYLCCHNKIINSLRDKSQDLENMIAAENIRVEASRNNVQTINPVVEAWLNKAEEIKEQSSRIVGDAVNVGLNRCCPNLKSRYLLSRRAAKMTPMIVDLQREGNFAWVSCSTAVMPHTSTGTFTTFDSRISIMKDIIEALKADEIKMIGICGMGGVGKTTMVKEVKESAEVKSLYDEVAMATVSKDQNIFKIQGELGSVLGLKFNEEIGIEARADMLRTRLTNNKRILVILDDVWDPLDLDLVGVPIGSQWKGCKIVLTTRNEQVYNEMETQKKKKFTVPVLSKEDAWTLFEEKAEIGSETPPDLHSIAKEVAEECGGLPLAIVTVSKALRRKEMHAWNDALRRLRNPSATEIPRFLKEVYPKIKLSYDYLESDQAKSLIRLCCAFPEDEIISVGTLIRYGVGLGLFKDVETLAAKRDRVNSLIDDLISCHLLLEEETYYQDRHVQMHDVVRNVAIFIASQSGELHIVRHDTEMKEWPQNDTYEPYTAIYLMANKMLEIPAGRHIPKLQILQLECMCNKWVETGREILKDVFGEMEQLRVFSVQGMHVTSLTQSLHSSRNLGTLCLDYCTLSSDISFIGNLKNLVILSFFESALNVDLPSDIGQLVNLKCLDLRCSEGPRIIPYGVLSSLKKLEELYMGCYFVDVSDKERNQAKGASITELNLLVCLSTLQIALPKDLELLQMLKEFNFENLTRFDLEMDDQPTFVEFHSQNRVSLAEVDIFTLLDTHVNVLVRRTEMLILNRVKHFKNVVKDLHVEGLVNLKTLRISSCPDVEYIINAVDLVPENSFIKLESLDLYKMDNITEICHGNIPAGLFGKLKKVRLFSLPAMRYVWRGPIQPPSLTNLRDLHIEYCHSIKSIFPRSAVKCLMQLQRLVINACDMVEGIVSRETGEDRKDTEEIEFPKLEKLHLTKLPKCRSFFVPGLEDNIGSNDNHEGGIIQTLFNQQVILPSLEYLSVESLDEIQMAGWLHKLGYMKMHHCKKLSKVATADQILLLRNLHTLSVTLCDSLEAVFDFEGLVVMREHTQEILGQLKSMFLAYLPELTCIWRMVPEGIQGFHTLTSLLVEKCDSLRYLLTPVLAKLLVHLEFISVHECGMMETIVMKQEGEENMDIILFPRLRELYLENLNSLALFSSENYGFEFPSLEELVIENCCSMMSFCSGPLSTPKLKRVYVKYWTRWVSIEDLNNTIPHLQERENWVEEKKNR